MGVGEAADRLVELGEGERGAQFEAARALLLGDGDGGQDRRPPRDGRRNRVSAGSRRGGIEFGFDAFAPLFDPPRQRFIDQR